ncbi:heme peroxidase domain-containing protein [Ditylenchus destructor]|nr:heme peroxidase domain-containing protein [Ditylenchus destructor]
MTSERKKKERGRRTSATDLWKWLKFASLAVLCIQLKLIQADDDNPITRNFKCRINGCCDQHEWCRFWASMGECQTNRRWMNRNCQLACNACEQPAVRRPNSQPLPAPIPLPPVRRPAPQPFTTTTPRPPPPFFAPRRPPIPFTTTSRPLPPRPAGSTNPLERCRQIQADPSLAAEVMLRENLVFAAEDNSARRNPLSADKVVRSNIANACVPRLDEAECERSLCYNLYFRTMDGTCNNFRFPLRGAAFRPYSRLMPPEYDGGLSEPVSSIRVTRPTAREANRAILSSAKSVLQTEFNALLMQFGQFMSHDMAKTTLVPSAKCNICQNIPGRCMAIFMTPQDPNANFKRNTCIRVSRSSAICGSGRTKPRQQLNENTGYIDGSPIYGSSVEDLPKFREGRTGLLKMQNFNGMRLLPFDQTKCRGPGSCTATFVAGDSRVNLFVGLSSYHLLFTREHNRIANRLQRLNPHWSGDRLFQEARKIVGAQIQAICYREYLPKVLGSLFASTVGNYRGYDPNIDSTIANEFTAGAYRFGHGMIQEFYPRLDARNQSINFGGINFVDATLHSDKLIFQGGVDPIIRGMMATPLKRPQRLTKTITEQMFGSTDLGSINIQRGRDHGLPSYMRFRQLCGLPSVNTFDALSREILSETARENLRRIYSTPENIDFYVGGLLEDPVVRGLVGPTVACVVGPQFSRTRDGDRFYFENPGVFTRAQLAEIRRSSLSRIICDNGDNINFVPREAFRTAPVVGCNEIPQMDLSKWKE